MSHSLLARSISKVELIGKLVGILTDIPAEFSSGGKLGLALWFIFFIPLTIARPSLTVLPLILLAQLMKSNSTTSPEVDSNRVTASLVRWSLAIILLCGCGFVGAAAEFTKPSDNARQFSLAENPELDLLAPSEPLVLAKRFTTGSKDQTGADKTGHHWLALVEAALYPVVDVRQLPGTFTTLPLAKIYSLEQLNAPGAPPLA